MPYVLEAAVTAERKRTPEKVIRPSYRGYTAVAVFAGTAGPRWDRIRAAS